MDHKMTCLPLLFYSATLFALPPAEEGDETFVLVLSLVAHLEGGKKKMNTQNIPIWRGSNFGFLHMLRRCVRGEYLEF